ncbi:phage tail protein [Salmonella enterica subsp. enterica serovar Tennessee]|nr:phage tail protein [Salmonella enterica subsp. enterica serovar Tennessee]
MADFDNPFDAAVAMADEVILCHMGIAAVITSGQLEGKTFRGVFDDPENISFIAGGVRFEDSSPSLFVKTADILGLRRQDTLTIGGESFRVDRITPDDVGGCYIRLQRFPGDICTGRYYERS